MIRWYREDPEGFARVYGLRNLAESFSSIKPRLGGTVRGKSLATQTVEMFAKVVYYNLTV